MRRGVSRTLVGLLALPFTAYTLAVVWGGIIYGSNLLYVMWGATAFLAAVLCWWFAFRGHLKWDGVRLRHCVGGGLLIGGIGFLGGFVGPVLLAPGANQGPLLGIFVTGPMGFLIGVLFGAAYGWMRGVESD
jgi:hypothetical protein